MNQSSGCVDGSEVELDAGDNFHEWRDAYGRAWFFALYTGRHKFREFLFAALVCGDDAE